MFLITAFNPLCVALFDAFFIGFAEELAFRGYLFRAFAIIRVKTKSLFWPITAHAFLNFGYELITEHNMKVLEIFINTTMLVNFQLLFILNNQII